MKEIRDEVHFNMYTATRWQPPRALHSAEAWLILGPLLLGLCTKLQTKLLRKSKGKERNREPDEKESHAIFKEMRCFMCVSEKDKISYHFTFNN